MSGRHAASWADSAERELDAQPYIGRHRKDEPDERA